MKTITNDDLFETLERQYLSMKLLREKGAIKDGSRPIDREYTKKFHEAMDYRCSLPEQQQRISASLLGLIARVNRK